MLKEVLENARLTLALAPEPELSAAEMLVEIDEYLDSVNDRNAGGLVSARIIAVWNLAIYQFHEAAANEPPRSFVTFLDEVANEAIIQMRIPQCEERIPVVTQLKHIVDTRQGKLEAFEEIDKLRAAITVQAAHLTNIKKAIEEAEGDDY